MSVADKKKELAELWEKPESRVSVSEREKGKTQSRRRSSGLLPLLSFTIGLLVTLNIIFAVLLIAKKTGYLKNLKGMKRCRRKRQGKGKIEVEDLTRSSRDAEP